MGGGGLIKASWTPLGASSQARWSCLSLPGPGGRLESGQKALLLVLASAGTAGAVLADLGLAALVEDGLAFTTPDRAVKLKGEDDVLVVAQLADEAALRAQVAVVHVLGGEFNEGPEEALIDAVRDLLEVSNTVLVRRLQEVIPVVEPLAKLPKGSTPAQAQVVPQELQLLPAPLDEPHLLHMLIQRSVHQLQVDEGLGPDLRQEPQGLPADRALGEVPVMDDPGRNH